MKMRTYLLIILALVSLIALASCSHPKATEAMDESTRYQLIPTPDDGLWLITLKDGTRCLLYSNTNGRSGLSCNWMENRS